MPHVPFQETGTYPCPVCHCGDIQSLSLMEAMSCSVCQHIFTPQFEEQSLKLADSQVGLQWYWNGKRWQGKPSHVLAINWQYGVAAIAFVTLPTLIMGVSAYLFPPLPGTAFPWFPLAWTGLTFISHVGCLLYLASEYYQFPLGLYVKTVGRRMLGRVQVSNQ
ncbi:hypothetical protein PN462_12685 [Spirulina sp. CS-785/01]|uniref:hypothetical protein n=1 Tax=Spirulina sp. CS-785/01 TaxID=3021716 RepID=UPI00232F993F|nr:hypothetical protein [Spirulina sp. CS-785/01]MDB9313961.1 hypothetical protein [Spirulina sp. CS-785/01]